MYYILAENYAAKNDYTNATAMLEAVRRGRNCGANMLDGLITDQASFATQLLKEVRREYVEEGLIFLFYKKLNDLSLNWYLTEESFYFPLPENETVN